MGLEATLIILDNSKYSLNGDIIPSRLDAQLEACALLAQAKLDENQESTVGVMTMAGRAIQVLLTPIKEIVTIKGVFQSIESSGDSNFTRAIQIATLCLKHRTEKKLAQRIIVFTASPLQESVKSLEELGKKLKKNQIAIEIINLGEPSNEEKLRALVEAAKTGENCKFLNVEPSITPLTDVLSTSGIINKNLDEAANFGGMEPEDDEMAIAIRISLEEERQRQARLAAESSGQAPAQPAAATQTTAAPVQAPNADAEPTDLDKELIRKAKELTINTNTEGAAGSEEQNTKLADPNFILDIMKDLNIDPQSGEGLELMKQLEQEQNEKKGSKDNKKMDEEK